MKNNALIKIVVCILALMLMTALLCACSNHDEPDFPDETPSPEPVVSSEPVPEDTSEPTPAELPTELPECDDAGEGYIDRLTFIGDSTTYGLKAYSVIDASQVWTPSSGTLALFNQSFATIVYPATGEEIPIVDAVTAAKPEYLVLTIGVNGVSMMDEAAFKADYIDLIGRIKAASPDTKIICNSIYPVEASYEAKGNGINNEVIERANGWILQIAEETGTHFTNSASVLKGADGKLIHEYGNGDGLHLSPEGFNAVLNYLRTHAWL